jgi:hypothetical protein
MAAKPKAEKPAKAEPKPKTEAVKAETKEENYTSGSVRFDAVLDAVKKYEKGSDTIEGHNANKADAAKVVADYLAIAEKSDPDHPFTKRARKFAQILG